MDVTKLFELPQDKMTPLAADRLDAMIDNALATPQIVHTARTPSNQNEKQWRKLIAVAAIFMFVIAASLQLSNVAPMTTTANIASDPYDEVSDLLMMETFTVSSVN
jgi:hypothetical protein